MRSFDVSGTCNKCGCETRVLDQTLPPEEKDKLKEAMILLCHFHGDHTFELGEGDAPRIAPSAMLAGKIDPPIVSMPRGHRPARKKSSVPVSAPDNEEFVDEPDVVDLFAGRRRGKRKLKPQLQNEERDRGGQQSGRRQSGRA